MDKSSGEARVKAPGKALTGAMPLQPFVSDVATPLRRRDIRRGALPRRAVAKFLYNNNVVKYILSN